MGIQNGTDDQSHQADGLWKRLIRPDFGEVTSAERTEVLEGLIECGEAAAQVILSNLEAASEEDLNGFFNLPSLRFSAVGGRNNVRHIARVLWRIGGSTALQAASLLCDNQGVQDDETLYNDYYYLHVEHDTESCGWLATLVRRLSSERTSVASAASALLHLTGAEAVPAVCARLLPGPYKSGTEDSVACARWLGEHGDPAAIPILATALSHPTAEIAVAAADALGNIGDVSVETLAAILSPDAVVTDKTVTRTIGRYERDESVRTAAARALGKIGDRRALDALVKAIGTYDHWTSEAAILAVVALGGDSRAVVPILQARLLKNGGETWDPWDRIKAALQMGPQTFEALIDATKNSNDYIRSLALRALAETAEAKDGGTSHDVESAEQRERAAWRAVLCRDDQSASVRFSAIELLDRLDVPGLGDLLVPLLDDSHSDEYCISGGYNDTVGEAAADALPDDDEALESLRQALADGQLNAACAWKSFVDWNGSTEQIRGSVRHGEVIIPYILEAAKHGDEEVFLALGWLATTQVLERLGQTYLDDAIEILEARDAWEYAPEAFGRIPLRWLYRVGDEFRDASGHIWKITKRIPESDAWHALVFDTTQYASRSVSHDVKQSWWNMGIVASLIPVATGTLQTTLRRWETERKIGALTARHGAAPKSVELTDEPTVQQFAAAVGIAVTEAQKHLREHQGKLLAPRDRIAPDALSDLCDELNVILAPMDPAATS